MPGTSDWQAIVSATWDSIKGKVATDLPQATLGKPLSDQGYSQGLGVCSMLNSPWNDGSAIWGDDGAGTIRLTSLKVSEFTSVSAGSARFDNLVVQLPLPFGRLQASGRYSYEQPCAVYSFGKKGATTKVNGAGDMKATSDGGSLTYVLRAVDPDKALHLEMTGATVDGQRNIEVKPDGQPDNGFLRWLVDVFGQGLQQKMLIKSALDSFFARGQFGQDMVRELNRIIGETLAAQAGAAR